MISPERSHELLSEYAATRSGTAFRELVAGWTGMVYGTALRLTRGERALAEDITQDVFCRLAAAPEKVRNARALGPWLHAAATGLTMDALRREARRRRREESSPYVLMNDGDSEGTNTGDGRHGLAPEIDIALSSLPPHDSQLLIMRFWQQQDWRSIGRNFGLSDDAAQKRMSRALDRLRRILGRRGITSTSGILSTVLVGMVPQDLSAAAVLKIASRAQAPASTALTAAAMTTKTKAVIAAALLVAATAPLIYQQRRIDALEWELHARQGSVPAPSIKRTSVAAGEKEKAVTSSDASPAEIADSPNPVAPESTAPADPVVDVDAMNRGKVKEKAAALRQRLALTAEQETRIAEALEYGQTTFKISPPNVIPVKPTAEALRKMEDAISATLTADQQEEYHVFRAEEKANVLEAAANQELSRLQSMVTLSPEQKDQAFAAFSDIASRESSLPVLDPDREAPAIRETEKTRWAERQEALNAILTPEQMALYQQAGNPFRRGSGG